MVDGKTISLDGMFHVGESLMRFPGDFFYSIRESENCRCALEYLDRYGNVVMVGQRGRERTE
jgi:hypothetical protein